MVDWDDEAVTRIRYEKAPEDSFGYYPQWHADMLEGFAEEGGAILHIKVPDPELFRGIDSSKVSTAVKAAAVARKKYQNYTRNNKISWSLIKAPTRAWADKVFADLPAEKRVEAMWKAVFQMNRVGSEDPVAARLGAYCPAEAKPGPDECQALQSLHYRAPARTCMWSCLKAICGAAAAGRMAAEYTS